MDGYSVSGIHRQFSSFQLQKEMRELWHDIQQASSVSSSAQPSQSQRWNYRDLAPVAGALPVVSGLPQQVSKVADVWGNYLQGHIQPTLSGAGQLGRSAARSIRTAQSLSDGVQQMFMASDRYHQARMEADILQRKGEQEGKMFRLDNLLSDQTGNQEYDNLLMQMYLQLLWGEQECSARIIANMA